MEEMIKLYTVINEKRGNFLRGNRVVKKEYAMSELQEAIEEAKKYTLRCLKHSYYEGYYDDYTMEYKELDDVSSFVMKDGKLFGFWFAGESVGTGGSRETYKTMLELTEADTERTVNLYMDCRDHGDTMSESSTTAQLLTKENKDNVSIVIN